MDLIKKAMRWLDKQWNPCQHKWRILIEHYPSFASDLWTCKKCSKSQSFPNNEPPVKIKTAICDLGDVHIVNR